MNILIKLSDKPGSAYIEILYFVPFSICEEDDYRV